MQAGKQVIEKIGLLAETSWEVCNKIGGIYTVLSTKAKVLQEAYGEKLVFIGPDVWSEENPSPWFKESKTLFKSFSKKKIEEFDISVRCGKWDIPGSPQVILVKFNGVYAHLNSIFATMWEKFGVDSMHEYGDYREGCAFAVATAVVIRNLTRHLGVEEKDTIAHFNEWTTGMGLLYLRLTMPQAASIFTTHATSIGRSICGNGKPLYDYFYGYHGDQMAGELNMEAKHSLEKNAAKAADCFTAVSEITAKEAEQLLEIRPQVVTPNGFEPNFVPGDKKYQTLRKKGREKILSLVTQKSGKSFDKDALIVATSGRNEFRNKGIDIFLDSLRELEKINPEKEIIALVLVPSLDMAPIWLGKVNVMFIPSYLNGNDGLVDISYYDLLPAIDITVFPSYYEPWGYTPLESVAFGIPTVTSDKSGFGQWVLANMPNSISESGVKVIPRTDSNYHQAAEEIALQLKEYASASSEAKENAMKKAFSTSEKADWKYFIAFYYEAFRIAKQRRDQRI